VIEPQLSIEMSQFQKVRGTSRGRLGSGAVLNAAVPLLSVSLGILDGTVSAVAIMPVTNAREAM
jgi:hypothetical protein